MGSFHPAPSRPAAVLPPSACDAHVHVFGPRTRFPYAEGRNFTPAEDAPKGRLFALHERLGIERCVVVQSSCHGVDNRATENCLRAKPGRYVGIALVPLAVADAELQRLKSAGFRGVRFNFMQHLGASAPIAEVIAFARRLAPLGLHLQVHFASPLIHDLAPSLAASPVPVVIDHMGRVDAALGIGHADFARLRQLLREHRHVWVKVSACERASRQDWPYADATPFARKLVDEFGDRVLWGSDWPHPNLSTAAPDDGKLVDLLDVIAPDADARQRLLVDNPQRLYDFAPA